LFLIEPTLCFVYIFFFAHFLTEQAFFDNGANNQQQAQAPKPSKESIMSLFSTPAPVCLFF
jgi:hypothetical protein